MAKAIALVSRPFALRIDALRGVVVCGCALILICAHQPLPLLAL
jgi:hypothetical protein